MEVISLAGSRQEQLKLLQLFGFQKQDALKTLKALEGKSPGAKEQKEKREK